EPELPIVDPHHHLVDRANTGRYLLPELLADTGSSHNITATVYLEWLSMYRADGPIALRPVGEVEFANGVAAIAGSETYGKTKVCAGIVGYADLMLGAQVEEALEAMILAGGGGASGWRPPAPGAAPPRAPPPPPPPPPAGPPRGSSVNRPAGLLLNAKV